MIRKNTKNDRENFKIKLIAAIVLILAIIPLMATNCDKPPVTPDFNLTAGAASITVGQQGTTTITITKTGGLAGGVALSLSGQPAGVTETFNPSLADTTSVLTLNVANTVAANSYTLTVTGVAAGKTHTAQFTLIVKAVVENGAFELAATPVTITKQTIVLNNQEPQSLPTGSSNITITRKNGFSGAVQLTTQGLPTGVTSQFTPNPVVGGASVLKLTVAVNAPVGSHNVTIKGVSGVKTATVVFNLSIKAKVDTTAPTIVSVSPTNGSKGVNENAKVIVVFSEAMNQQSAQSAFQTPDIGPVTFAWSNGRKTMTVTPNNKLKYSNDKKYKYYNYSITTIAKDLAGNPLSTVKKIKFSTYRTHFWYYTAEPALDGYIYNNGGLYNQQSIINVGDIKDNSFTRGFVSFAMLQRPKDIIGIRAADLLVQQKTVVGKPYSRLGQLNVYHLLYGNKLIKDDFSRPPLPGAPRMLSNKPALGLIKVDVTTWVQDDYNNRATRNNRSQFRLQFAKDTDGKNDYDYVTLHSSEQGDRRLMPAIHVWYWVK